VGEKGSAPLLLRALFGRGDGGNAGIEYLIFSYNPNIQA
jgi:hypothetical protein